MGGELQGASWAGRSRRCCWSARETKGPGPGSRGGMCQRMPWGSGALYYHSSEGMWLFKVNSTVSVLREEGSGVAVC